MKTKFFETDTKTDTKPDNETDASAFYKNYFIC